MIDKLRNEIPACKNYTYVDVSGRCPMSNPVAATIAEFVSVCQNEGARKDEWVAKVEQVRGKFAAFIEATADEIAFTKNISEGLNIIINGLDYAPGDNIVFVSALEHPNLVYALNHLRARGVEIHDVAMTGYDYNISKICAQVDARTRLVCLSSVSFRSGARVKIKEIADILHKKGVPLLIDSAQSLGIMDINVAELGIDAMAGSIQKGMMGTYGMGVLYCKKEFAEKLVPVFLAKFSVAAEDKREFIQEDPNRVIYAAGARRFEIGNYNYMGIYILDTCLDILMSIGINEIEKKVLGLSGVLIDELVKRGYKVLTPITTAERGGIVSFLPKDPKHVWEQMTEKKIKLSLRGDIVRVSFHVYNNMDDVVNVIKAIDDIR